MPILRSFNDLTNDEILDILISGMDEDVLETLSSAHEFAVYTSGQVLRLYDKRQGFVMIAPTYSLVSYSISTCQFNLNWGFRYNQWNVFQKMLCMHLDFMGLIEAGLAINKKELPKYQ